MGDQLRACQAAAPVGFGQLHKFEAVDHFQQGTGLLPNTLGAAQVAMLRSAGWQARPAYWAAYYVIGKD